MALKSNNTSLAIAIQPTPNVFQAPSQPADLMLISDCRPSIASVNIVSNEYTGSPFKNADFVAGKKVTISHNVKLRPPGGGVIPAANAFNLGKILQAAKFTEVRTAAAIPVAAEAITAGTTTGGTLGAGATGTLDLYKAMAILLLGMGATYKDRMTAIRAYTAGKVVTFAETFGSAVSGNYQIPSQIGYVRDVTASAPPLISLSVWLDGHRLDLMNCALSQLQIVVPTSTKDQAAYPELQVTWDCTIAAQAAQTTPATPALGGVPFYKDGKFWLANTKLGIQTFTLDLGLQTENPPNPNMVDGNDAAEIVGGTATMSMTRQKYLPSTFDSLTLADAQAYHAAFAQWGTAAGQLVQIVVCDGRLDYQNPDLGGNIIMESGNLMIDALSKNVAINFPY